MRQITILMIGLGRIGGKFYQQFTKLDEARVKIIAVSEPNMTNPLLEDAKTRGIANHPNFEEAIREYGSKIDIIMDTSNRPEIKLAVRKLLQETENKHTVLVPMVVDYLMWYLLPDAEAIPQSHHSSIGY
ncbi:MAG: homoserine dehydrogenase [Thiomicrospira sp.]|nr:homoserine dehydrogenase [Thiomicrospira sp.]